MTDPSKATTTTLVAEVFDNIFTTQLEKHNYEEVFEEHVNSIFYEKVPQKLCEKLYIIAKQESSTDHIIGRIEYMFQKNNKLFAHIMVFIHGANTVLGSKSEVGELFLLNKCVNIDADNILNTIDVRYINPSENRNNLNCNKKNSCFYMFNLNEELSRIENVENSDNVFDSKNRIQICSNCTKEDLQIKSKDPQLIDFIEENKDIYYFYNFNLHNEEYKVGSFVYLQPGFYLNASNEEKTNVKHDDNDYDDDENEYDDDENEYDNDVDGDDYEEEEEYTDIDAKRYPEYYRTGKSNRGHKERTVDPFEVCQITSIYVQKNDKRKVRANVRLMYRPEKIAFRKDYKNDDMNLLFWSEDQFEIECKFIKGKCYVSHIMNIKDPISWSAEGPDRFYFKYGYETLFHKIIPEYKLSCEAKLTGCDHVDVNKKQNIPCYEKISPLRGMDLFAGCGGFSDGLKKSKAVETKWAVEIDHYAAEAFKLNNADSIVFNDDCNKLLKLALSGKTTNNENQKIPVRGQVDIIFGGPPCQGFSGMNKFNYTEKSMRLNALSATFLSYVDYYRPKFFIMENVQNFTSINGGAFLSATLKAVINMGYQSTFGILQAGHFGVAQNRRRLIIIGAAPGEKLPFLPKPKHVFKKKNSRLTIKFGDKMYKTNSDYDESAPLRTVTIYDSISDLPKISNGANKEYLEYINKPLTHYQKLMRYPYKLSTTSVLKDHICKAVSPLTEARIKLLDACQNWQFLPNIQVELSDGTVTQILKYNHYDQKNGNGPDGAHRGVCGCVTSEFKICTRKKKQENTIIPYSVAHTANNNNNWDQVLGKPDPFGHLPTITQNPDPLGKQGTVLHYEQARILSLKECARLQGFDDEFIFYGTINSKYSQIGNAVSPPMAKAIGEELVKAVINKSK